MSEYVKTDQADAPKTRAATDGHWREMRLTPADRRNHTKQLNAAYQDWKRAERGGRRI